MIARFIAAIFAVLFVITTILAILSTTIDRRMLKSNLYKNALAEQNFHERFPSTFGRILSSIIEHNFQSMRR